MAFTFQRPWMGVGWSMFCKSVSKKRKCAWVEFDCVLESDGRLGNRAKLPGVRPDGQVGAEENPILEFQKKRLTLSTG